MKGQAQSSRVAILISGGGTNLQSFIDARQSGSLAVELAVVISNVRDAGGLHRAEKAGIPGVCIPHRDYASREDFEQALSQALLQYAPDIIVLAGFMRVLTPAFVARHAGKILNIHPSLLPAYPGLHTHQRVLQSGDAWHGCSVHFVIDDLDAGPLIIQGRVKVQEGDSEASLAARVLRIEHRIYPMAAALLASGRLNWNHGDILLDGKRLEKPLMFGQDSSASATGQ